MWSRVATSWLTGPPRPVTPSSVSISMKVSTMVDSVSPATIGCHLVAGGRWAWNSG